MTASLGVSVPLAGQEPDEETGAGWVESEAERSVVPEVADTIPADTILRADTIPADTIPPPIPEPRPPDEDDFQRFPLRLLPAAAATTPVYVCDRECLLDSPWLTLAELVSTVTPGLLPVRAGWFSGPHHLVQGLGGAGTVRLSVDGRDLLPLESGQADLLRISLVQLDEVRVYRRADGVVVDVSTRRHERPTAYSRITGGSAQPRGELLRGIFTNRWGRQFLVGAAFDLVDLQEEGRPHDRFDFWGRLSWVPDTDRTGLELDYRSQSLGRVAADTVDLGRRDLVLRGRTRLGDDVEVEAVAGRSELQEGDERIRRTLEAGLSLAARLNRVEVVGSARLYDGEGLPSGALRGRTGIQLSDGLSLDVGAEVSSWPEFTAAEGRAALALEVDAGLPLLLGLDGATGRRGVPRPTIQEADSVSYDAAAAAVETALGPYRLRGRGSWERTSRHLSLGAAFDRQVAPRGETELLAWEVGLEGPVLPVGAIVPGLSTMTGQGYWRFQEPVGGEDRLYVPRHLAGGRLLFVDHFFEENLEIRLAADVLYRGAHLAAGSGRMEPVALPRQTLFFGHFQARIAGFRLFWKFLNPAALTLTEVADVPIPRQVNVFGIHWEFLN